MMARRNLPNINPNGVTFRGVRVHGYGKRQNHRRGWPREFGGYHDDPFRLSLVWRRVMAQVSAYQAAGFSVTYTERFENDHKVADITIEPWPEGRKSGV